MKYNYTKRVSNKKYNDTTIKLNHLRAFRVKYSDTSINIKDLRHGKSRRISKDYRENSHLDTAIKYLNNILKVEGFSCLEVLDFDIVFTTDFETAI